MKNIESTDKNQEKIKELFKELVSEKFYDIWEDTFDIEISDDNRVDILYHGTEKIKKFKKECADTLISCIYSVLGTDRKIKITGKKVSSLSPKTKKNIKAFQFFFIGMIFVCIATAVIVVLCSYIGNRNFRETFYNASSIKVDGRIRVIQLSDMHGSSYGKNNNKLLERIEALEPDVIICTGDIADSVSEDTDYAVSLGKALSKIAPSYYIYGNNESEGIYDFKFEEGELDKKFSFNENNRDETAILKLKDSFEEKLEASGIKVLKNEKDTIKIKNQYVDIYGVLTSNPSAFWSYSGKSFSEYLYENKDNFKITAVHEPFIFRELDSEFWGDLMLAGHYHGGMIKVPVLGALYTHEGGLFPARKGDFVYGRYDVEGCPLIVSSGLDNSNMLRINNQPELVIIDVNKF